MSLGAARGHCCLSVLGRERAGFYHKRLQRSVQGEGHTVSHSQGVNRDLYRGRATQLVTARV